MYVYIYIYYGEMGTISGFRGMVDPLSQHGVQH